MEAHQLLRVNVGADKSPLQHIEVHCLVLHQRAAVTQAEINHDLQATCQRVPCPPNQARLLWQRTHQSFVLQSTVFFQQHHVGGRQVAVDNVGVVHLGKGAADGSGKSSRRVCESKKSRGIRQSKVSVVRGWLAAAAAARLT